MDNMTILGMASNNIGGLIAVDYYKNGIREKDCADPKVQEYDNEFVMTQTKSAVEERV